MSKKIRYFVTQHKDTGEELPHIQWSRKINAIIAMAHPSGVYISAIPEVWELLEAQQYVEVDADYLTSLRIDNPVPDRVDYTKHEDRLKFTEIEQH